MTRYMVGVALACAVVMTAGAAEDLKSGLQKPTMKITPFNPLHCSGSTVGKKNCIV